MMETPYKLGQPGEDPDSTLHSYVYPNVWAEGKTTAGPRLVIAPANAQIDILLGLLEVMPEPMWLLYILVVPRTADEPGRYQGPDPQTRDGVRQFLKQFEVFLETDGRHHLWIACANSPAMLIYDRHNLIYAYGPLDSFKARLAEMNLEETNAISVPDPHSHHYHEHLDLDAARLMKLWSWNHTALRESDSE